MYEFVCDNREFIPLNYFFYQSVAYHILISDTPETWETTYGRNSAIFKPVKM
jgi:hypothetical protein